MANLLDLVQEDHCSFVLPGLYLGSREGGEDAEKLQKLGVTHVLTILGHYTPKHPEKFTYHVVELNDTTDSDLMSHFPACCRFISKARRSGGGVIVHCAAGISRSATVVLAYLMREEKFTLDDAIVHLKQARPVVSPNDGFMRQLKHFQRMECRLPTESPPAQTPISGAEESGAGAGGSSSVSASDLVAALNLSDDAQNQDLVYTCSRCRAPLFESDHVIEHTRPGATGKKFSSKTMKKQVGATSSKCTSLFMDKQPWMGSTSEPEGKISCPKCGHRVGSYNWAGIQCSCTSWVTPAFQVSKSKLDPVPRALFKK